MLYQLSYASNYLFTTMYITSTSADQVGCPHFVPVARVSFEKLFPQCTDRRVSPPHEDQTRLQHCTDQTPIVFCDRRSSSRHARVHRHERGFGHRYGESRETVALVLLFRYPTKLQPCTPSPSF